jgi:hypothetical protein
MVKVSMVTVKVWLDGNTAYETGKYKYEGNGSWKLSIDMAVPEN